MRNPQDHAAWIEFVSLYETPVYRILRQHGLQDADARELMQDLFLALSRNIDHWDPDRERGSFRGYLRRACRNLVSHWSERRRRSALAVGEPLWQTLAELPAPGPESRESPESVEFDREVKRALFHRAAAQVRTEVRPGTWQAFWETGVLGTSTADAAQKLGMSAGAVRVARYRVLSRLQTLIRAWEKPE
jgi:RNA polymerase sigma-70 factor (ECF subfamily)